MTARRAAASIAVAVVCGVAAMVRWRVADRADSGIDQAANLWLGTQILGGTAPTVGLSSSLGILNLAGVPLLAAPLARLPDLLAVSRALSLSQLAMLVALGLALARRRRGALAVAGLAFCPAAVLVSATLWNQYVALPINAGITALLLMLAERARNHDGVRLDVAALLTALLLLQPAVHLVGFGDLAAQGLVALAVLGVCPPRQRGIAVELGIAIAVGPAFILYGPWLMRVAHIGQHAALAAAFIAGSMAVLAVAQIEGRLMTAARRAGESTLLAWCVPLMLIAGATLSVIAFWGTQMGERLLTGDAWGPTLLAASIVGAALVVPALPPMIADCRAGRPLGTLLHDWFPNREAGAAVLIANAGLLLVWRAILVPAAFTGGRTDLLVSLLPALLAPAILLAVTTARPMLRAWSAGTTMLGAALVVAFAVAGPSERFAQLHPDFLPASEMRAVADWIAAQPDAVDADGQLDVAYDLGREDAVRVACSPISSWYTTTRPFDWLFLRRHGLRDRREGSCLRVSGGRFLVTYRAAPAPPDRQLRLALQHLAVWQ